MQAKACRVQAVCFHVDCTSHALGALPEMWPLSHAYMSFWYQKGLPHKSEGGAIDVHGPQPLQTMTPAPYCTRARWTRSCMFSLPGTLATGGTQSEPRNLLEVLNKYRGRW